MVVICPKCKTRLKVDENRLLPKGSRFKCPKCTTILVVKKPAARAKRPLNRNKILIAHSNLSITENISSLLTEQGYSIIKSSDGIDAMVKALNELPFLSLVEVVLPKIYGFEVCKRLKSRPETQEMKFILITTPYDKEKYRREPDSLHGADDYVEDHELSTVLIDKINILLGLKEKERELPEEAVKKEPEPAQPPPEKPGPPAEPLVKEVVPPSEEKPLDEKIERARRLARTIINDIHLYNSAKVEKAIRDDNLYSVFETELSEGRKLYVSRIPQDVRDKGDFFTEAIENFISSKKKALG